MDENEMDYEVLGYDDAYADENEVYDDDDDMHDEAMSAENDEGDVDRGDDDDASERLLKRRGKKRRSSPKSRRSKRSGSGRANGSTGYALAPAGHARNASGIKALNDEHARTRRAVQAVGKISAEHDEQLAMMKRQLERDGAITFAEAVDPQGQLDLFQVFKGAVKSGLLNDAPNLLNHPLSIGVLALLLKNPELISKLTGASK